MGLGLRAIGIRGVVFSQIVKTISLNLCQMSELQIDRELNTAHDLGKQKCDPRV